MENSKFEEFEKLSWNYLFVIFKNKDSFKYKSRDLIALAKYLEWNKEDVVYYSIMSKTVDATQYEEMV